MYKLIACDLDGTLLKTDKTISRKTIDIIKKISEKGVFFVPATGRSHVELPEEIRNKSFIKYGICINGAEIYDYENGRCISEEPIPNTLAIDLLTFTRDYPVYPSLVIYGDRYMQSDESGEIIPEIKKIAVKSILKISKGHPDLCTMLKESKQDVHKILFYPKYPEDIDRNIKDLKSHFPNLNICTSGPMFIEVNSKNANKGNGLQKLCKFLEIDIKDVLAFGDEANDIPLLQMAGKAVAMGNSLDEVRRYSDDLALSSDDDGVRKYLENLFKVK